MQVVIKEKLAWEQLRSAVVADDTLLSALGTYAYSNVNYKGRMWEIPDKFDSIVIAAYGKDAATTDIKYVLHGRRARHGPIEILAEGIMTLGTLVVTTDPITGDAITAFWVQTITNTASWLKTPVIKNSGNNGICQMGLDLAGLSDVGLEVDLDGGDAVAMTEFSAIIAGIQQ